MAQENILCSEGKPRERPGEKALTAIPPSIFKEQPLRCNPELTEVLETLSYAAWIETLSGELVFRNQAAMEDVASRRGEPVVGDLVEPIAASSERSSPRKLEPVSAVTFPVFCAIGGELRIVVACRKAEEKARDQELALVLWGRLLKSSLGEEERRLSAQQRQVYRMLRRDMSYKEIAGALGVAHATVRVQVAAIRKILGEDRVPVLRRKASVRTA